MKYTIRVFLQLTIFESTEKPSYLSEGFLWLFREKPGYGLQLGYRCGNVPFIEWKFNQSSSLRIGRALLLMPVLATGLQLHFPLRLGFAPFNHGITMRLEDVKNFPGG